MPTPSPHATADLPSGCCERSGVRMLAVPEWVVCDQCEALHQRVRPPVGESAHCLRCNALIGRGHLVTLNGLLAVATATLIFLLIGNLAPLVTLELGGQRNEMSLPQAIVLTWRAGQQAIAVLSAATAIVFPLALTLLRLYVLVPLARGTVPAGFNQAMHSLRIATQWSMVEVLMLGALVAVVRSASLGHVTPGFGLLAYAAVTLLLTSVTAAGLHMLWKMADRLGDDE
jgi:paraquat-inducible protein A